MNEPFKVLDVRCAVYARVSTDMPGQKDSMENQKSFFEYFIKEKGWTMVETYADEGVTGTSTAKRYELQRLMIDAENKRFEVLLIKSLSRFARDVVDGLTLIRALKSYGIKVMTIDENYNSELDKGEMLLMAYFMVAQQESEAASRRIKFGIAEKSRKGIFHGSAPFGYINEKGKLFPHEEYANVVKLIFDLYLDSDWGFQKIANYLTDTKIPTPRKVRRAKNAGNVWQENTVEGILRNPHYTGNLHQGRSAVNFDDKKQHSEKGYKSRTEIPLEKWHICKDTHEAIIPVERFELVQEKIAYRSSKRYRGRGKKSLFSRLAYCSDCGKGMNYKNDREGYVCGTYQKQGSKKCASHFIKHDQLKKTLLWDIQNLAQNAVDREGLMQTALQKVATTARLAQNKLTKAEKKHDRYKNELLELVRLLTRKEIDRDTFKHTQDQLNEEISRVEKEIRTLKEVIANEKKSKEWMKQFQAEVERFSGLDINDEEALRNIFQKLVERIEIQKDGAIHIHYNFKNPMVQGQGA